MSTNKPKAASLDDYGYFGPEYSYADNIPLPGQIGVRQESSIGAIIDSVAGINTYADIIGFGAPTFFDQQENLQPMGIRYYLNTGVRCSNGATMSKYTDTVPKGDMLGKNVKMALESAGLPTLKGLAPGMLESARDALDPRPILSAITTTGYPVCQQVMCPVGDLNGNIVNRNDPENPTPYMVDPVEYVNGVPKQKRWVQAYDADGEPLTITRDEFAVTPKCYNPNGTYKEKPPRGCPKQEPSTKESAGGREYPLCSVVRPATLPPPLQASKRVQVEGFIVGDSVEKVFAALAVACLGGALLWVLRSAH